MEEKKKNRVPVVLIIIFIIILAALYAYLYLLPGISDSRSRTVVVNYATIQAYSENKCIVVRNETVYKTHYGGSVSYYSKEGEKTRQGTMVADVYSAVNRESISTETTGTVSFFIDEKEDFFTPESFASLDPEEIASMEDIIPQSVENKEAGEDSAVFKLVTSDIWYLLIINETKSDQQLKIGQSIIAEFPGEDRVPAVISDINEGTDHILYLAEIHAYYEKSPQLRSVDVKIISSEESGLLIPTSAITSNGENIGVYVLSAGGDYIFKPIEIITQTKDETLIEEGGSVRLYDEVLKDARNFKN